jgi:hypothetical protein
MKRATKKRQAMQKCPRYLSELPLSGCQQQRSTTLPWQDMKEGITNNLLVKQADGDPHRVYEAMLKLLDQPAAQPVVQPTSAVRATHPPSTRDLYMCTHCSKVSFFYAEMGCGGFTCPTCFFSTPGYISNEKPYSNREDDTTREHWTFIGPQGPSSREKEIELCAGLLPNVPDETIQTASRLVHTYATNCKISSLKTFAIAALLIAENPDLVITRVLRNRLPPVAAFPCALNSSCTIKHHSHKSARYCTPCYEACKAARNQEALNLAFAKSV